MGEFRSNVEAHSLTEAWLCLWVMHCWRCDQGPLEPGTVESQEGRRVGLLAVPVRCRSCGAEDIVGFVIPDAVQSATVPSPLPMLGKAPDAPPLPINPTDEPSRAIDVADWLTLEAMISDRARAASGQARNMAQRASVRKWQLLAGACLDEALKFYDADNDLPPEDAFFCDASLRQFRDRPAMFARQRLIELRGRRPIA